MALQGRTERSSLTDSSHYGIGQRPRRRHALEDASGNLQVLAKGLGLFSVGLGLTQLLAPALVTRATGTEGNARNRSLMRSLGARELAAGVGILASSRPTGWLWARVAGDITDLALLSAAARSGAKRTPLGLATAAVAGVTFLDAFCAQELAVRGGGARAFRGGQPLEVAHSITIARPPEELYRFWHDFENLPRFMRHLQSVDVIDERRSRWQAKGPLGMSVQWEAEIIDDKPDELIAWRSVEGAEVYNTGYVRFDAAPGTRGTEVHVRISYRPPAGKAGALFAQLFGENPEQQIRDDLRAFKQVAETGSVVRSDASLHRLPHAARPTANPMRPILA